jgi:hypothetical protein
MSDNSVYVHAVMESLYKGLRVNIGYTPIRGDCNRDKMAQYTLTNPELVKLLHPLLEHTGYWCEIRSSVINRTVHCQLQLVPSYHRSSKPSKNLNFPATTLSFELFQQFIHDLTQFSVLMIDIEGENGLNM